MARGSGYGISIVTFIVLAAVFLSVSMAPHASTVNTMFGIVIVHFLRMAAFLVSGVLLLVVHCKYGAAAQHIAQTSSHFVEAVAVAGVYIFIVGVIVTSISTTILSALLLNSEACIGRHQAHATLYSIAYVVYSPFKIIFVVGLCTFVHTYRLRAFSNSRFVRLSIVVTFGSILWLYLDTEVAWSKAIENELPSFDCFTPELKEMAELNRQIYIYFFPFVCEFCLVVCEALVRLFFQVQGTNIH